MNTIKFLPEYIEPIKTERKTHTRRPVKPQPRPGRRETLTPPYGDVGDLVEVEGQGLTIKITGVRTECIRDISQDDIHAEGFDSHISFVRAWDGIYKDEGFGWFANPIVYVYQFELLEGTTTQGVKTMKKRLKQLALKIGYWFLGFSLENGFTAVPADETQRQYRIQVQAMKITTTKKKEEKAIAESIRLSDERQEQLDELIEMITHPPKE